METPFIVKKMLEETINGLIAERDRGDVYSVEQRDLMTDIGTSLQNFLNAEKKAEQDAEFAEQYPEHLKFDKVRDKAQAIGEFIEHSGWILCDWPDNSRYPVATNLSINNVLAKYFEIDEKKLEDEKQRMLAALASPKSV